MKTHIDYRAIRYLDIFSTADEDIKGQINVSVINPATICAFHRHIYQVDYWIVIKGALEVITHRSHTAETNRYILKDGYYLRADIPDDPRQGSFIIPVDVWHGYRCIGREPAILLYYVSKKYNNQNPDEFRASPDELGLKFETGVK